MFTNYAGTLSIITTIAEISQTQPSARFQDWILNVWELFISSPKPSFHLVPKLPFGYASLKQNSCFVEESLTMLSEKK